MPNGCLNMVAIEIHTHTPSGYINTDIRNINLYAQCLSHYTHQVAILI